MSKAKGEVGFDADGGRFTLTFSIEALCELEEAAGFSMAKIGTILKDPEKPNLRIVKCMFWAALTDHHPDITQKDASKLMSQIGFVNAGQLVLEAFALAFPETASVPLESKPRPSSKRAPTGARLTANG